jgi:cation:H+ antiporter
MDWVWIMLGVLGLWLGTEIAVRSGGEIGRRLGLSEMFLGLTVFAIGTDVSELFVAVGGSIRQLQGESTSGLIVGNALGSVLAQGGLVLGVIAFFSASGPTLSSRPPTRDALVWFGASVLLFLTAEDGVILRWEGALLATSYVAYFVVLLRANVSGSRLLPKGERQKFALPAIGLVAGLGIVGVSADLALEHGLRLAEKSGIDAAALGLFAFGAGTSLPELVVSLGAAARGRPALSLGNVLGSNTFDLLVPLGIGATLHPLAFEANALRFDLPAVVLFAVYFAARTLTGGTLARRDAAVLFGLYAAYFLFRMGTVAG